MAGPSKRRRTNDDDDDDHSDEVEIESASSSFQQRGNKRTRIAEEREFGTVLSDDNDGLGDDGYANGSLETNDSFTNDTNQDDHDNDTEPDDPDNEVTMLHLDDDADDDEANFDELAATQVVGKEMKRSKEKQNIVQEEGIIEEIYCRNFMCHSKLRIALGPNINFIIGHNGSGKSAVLTALTMCLGAKAAQTNRGASLKSLIKAGTDNATLGVSIKNQGENAYKHEMYGNKIIVERHFNRAGTSGFKLKSENDKTISTKRADLDDILDYFGLQLDNPINVLTQDMARQFLSNSSGADKYKFFLRGTMLEALDADYKVLEMNLDNIESKLELRKGDITILKEKHDAAEARKERAGAMKRIEEEVARLSRIHAWAQVRDEEDRLKRYQEDVERAEEEVRETEEAAGSVDARFEAAEAKLEAVTRTVAELTARLDPAKAAWGAAKADLDTNKDKLTSYVEEERQMKSTRRKAMDEIKKLEEKIVAEEALLADQGGEAHARRQVELEDLRTALREAEEAQQQHDDQLAGLQNASKTARSRLDDAEKTVTEARTALQAAQGSLQQLEREENNKYAPYMPNMERLCNEINRETRWREKPVGPLGLHIHLQKPEWSSVLETTFGGSLNAFAVTNRYDADIFSKIAKRVNCNAGIFVGASEPLDTRGKEPSGDIDTILRVLTIKSDIVRNQLIINQAIEQVALVRNSDDAIKFMYPSTGGHPDKVKVTLSIVENSRGNIAGQRWTFTRTGASRSDPVKQWAHRPRMQTDRSQQLQMARGRVDQAKRELDEAQQHRTQANNALTRANQALVAHKRESARLKIQTQRADDAVDAKKTEIDNNRPQDGKLQELQSQLVDAKKEKQDAETSLEDLYEQKAVYDDKAPGLLAAANNAQEEVNVIEQRIAAAEAKVLQADNKRRDVLYEKNEAHEQIKTKKQIVERLQKKVDDQQAEVASYTEQASAIYARVPVEEGVTVAAVDKKIEDLKAQVDRQRRELGATAEELTRAWTETRKTWKAAQTEFNQLKRNSKLLTGSLKERHYRWKKFRHYISCRARIQFSYLLSERQFRGRINFHHEEKTLSLKVEPDMAKSSDAGREARTLSGGEKSFSTICFLLSIWEAMGSPIRCLDEFDVFMDSVNRAQSMSLMIQAARRSAGRQFILITPQAMGNVEMGEDVRIHKMSDPERGQTNLNFNGQEL